MSRGGDQGLVRRVRAPGGAASRQQYRIYAALLKGYTAHVRYGLGMPDDPLISLRQMAERAEISPGTMRKYRSQGRLPPPDDTSVPGRPRWRASTFDAWMQARPGRGARTDLHRGRQADNS